MSNIQIAVRVRPLIEREKNENLEPLWEIRDNCIVQTSGGLNGYGDPYTFDHIFNESQSNENLYHSAVKPLVLSCLEGINATILAYGQTSSGKTHTVLGTKDNPGVITHAVKEIFNYIENESSRDFLLRCSYLEIYNERVNDLLNPLGTDLKIREDYNQQVYVEKAQEEVVHTPDDFFSLMKRGMKTRKIGCTDMNERSSRSHTILKLVIQSQCKNLEGAFTESVLSLVDLAGSERVGQMAMGGSRQIEGVSINKSLTTLALVIRRLSENETFVNYRDSKLTRLLQHSLGGNSKTLIIATVTVAASEETKSTLEFAQRAKTVKNRPEVNRRVTDKVQLKAYERLCETYKSQIETLYLEKLEKERTIDALNGKISNIRLFTDSGSNRHDGERKIRRHTMLSHSHGQQFVSPLKSTPIFTEPGTPPAKLRLEKQLLEVSYERLKEFTSLERQTEEGLGYLNDRQEQLTRLMEENCNYQIIHKTILTELKDARTQLLNLKMLLSIQDNNAQGLLSTIIEEEMPVWNFDSVCDLMDQFEVKEQRKAENNVDVLQALVSDQEKQIDEFKITITALESVLKEKELLETTYEEEISKKNDEINQLKDQVTQLSQGNLTKDQELSKLRLCLSERVEEISNLNQDVAELAGENLELTNPRLDCVDQAERLSILQQSFSNKVEEINRLNALVDSLNDRLANANQDMECKLAEISKENAIKEQEMINLRVDLADTSQKLSDLQKSHSCKIEEIDRLNFIIDSLNDKIANANKDITLKDQEISKLQLKSQERVLLENKLAEINEINANQEQEMVNLRDDLSDTNEKLANLQSLLSHKTEEINRLNQIIDSLHRQLASAKKDITIKDQELAKLQLKNVDVLEKKLAEINKDNAIKEQEIVNLRDDLSDTNEKLAKLHPMLSHKTEEINRLNEVIDSLHRQLAYAKKDITNKDQELAKLQLKNVDALEKKLAEISEINANQEQEMVNLRDDLSDTNEKLAKLHPMLSHKTEEINRLNEVIDSLHRQLAYAKKDITNKDQELAKLQLKNVDALEKKLAEISEINANQEQEMVNLRDDLSDTNEKLANLHPMLSHKTEEINRLNEVIDSLHRQLAYAKKDITNKDQELAKLQLKNVDALEKKLAEISEINANQEQEMVNLRDDLSDTNEKLANLHPMLSHKTEEINRLNEVIDSLHRQLAYAKKNITIKDQELAKLQLKNVDVLEKKLDEINKDNAIKEQEMVNLRDDLSDRNEKLANLQSLLSHKTEEINRLNSLLDASNNQKARKDQEVIDLRAQLLDKNRQLSNQQKSLSNNLDEIQKLKAEVNLLGDKLAKTTKDHQELRNLQLSEKNQEISTLQQSILEQKKEILKLKSECDNNLLKKKLAEVDKNMIKNQVVNLQSSECDRELRDLRQSVAKVDLLKDQLAKTNSDLSIKDQELEKLRLSLSKRDEEIQVLKSKVADLLKKKLSRINDQDCIKNQELDNLRQCIANKDKEIYRLGQKIAQTDPFKERYNEKLTTEQINAEEDPFNSIFDDFNPGRFKNENKDLKRELKLTQALRGASEKKCQQQSAVIDQLTATNLKMTETVEKLKEEVREARRQRSATPPQSDCLSLSPKQVRKMKRRSIHDQRRGLSPGIEDLPNTFNELHKESTKDGCGNRQPVQVVDKACQIEEISNSNTYRQQYEVLCEKYTALQKVARYRRREANHLRLQLNIEPDAPVLPVHE